MYTTLLGSSRVPFLMNKLGGISLTKRLEYLQRANSGFWSRLHLFQILTRTKNKSVYQICFAAFDVFLALFIGQVREDVQTSLMNSRI